MSHPGSLGLILTSMSECCCIITGTLRTSNLPPKSQAGYGFILFTTQKKNFLSHKKVVSLTITQLGINENNDYFLSKAFQQNSKIRIITLEYRLTPVWSYLF